ncbi:WXG100 family type VII secretion target [Herpetosiphon sp. NSE202]|uniref:WXG100 family type VII secretion target n=1 Tax=Herpetosiphon sp. NSE202 TaxID=3351349 RepID=UPI00363D8213
MGAAIIQVDYDGLKTIAQKFTQQSSTVKNIVSMLQQASTPLFEGQWQGSAAAAFRQEFETSVIPSFAKLIHVLDSAAALCYEISTVMNQAEEEAAAFFKTSPNLYQVQAKIGANPSIDDLRKQIHKTIDGLGTDEEGLFKLLENANPEEKKAILADTKLMDSIKDDLSRSDYIAALEKLNAPAKDRLNAAMDGWGTDEASILKTLNGASDAEKIELAKDRELIKRFKDELSGQELTDTANALVKTQHTAPGKVQEGTGKLILSDREIDQNSALHIMDGSMKSHYIEDLQKHPDSDSMVAAMQLNKSQYSILIDPDDPTKTILTMNGSSGFTYGESDRIFVSKHSSTPEHTIVHEINHALNKPSTDTLSYYESEFRAYSVDGNRMSQIQDPQARAVAIRNHIVKNYPNVKHAYDNDPAVRAKIDAMVTAGGNLTNQ